MNGIKRITVSVKVSPDVWKLAKIYAAEKGLRLGQVVENALLREIRP